MGVSLDDVETLREYREREGMPFPLLSDCEKDAGTAFGVYYRLGLGRWAVDLFQTSAFVTDAAGVIVGAWGKGGHQQELLRAALALDRITRRG